MTKRGPWGAEEIEELKRGYRERLGVKAIAARLDRSQCSVWSKAAEIGVVRQKRRNPDVGADKSALAARLHERDRRNAFVATPNMAVLGDPPPGRSALEQRAWQPGERA